MPQGSDENITLSDVKFERFLGQKSRRATHERQQMLLNALTTIAKIAIYVVPSILAALYVAVLVNKAHAGQWDILEDTLKSMLVPIVTYLAGLLSKNVLPHSEN